MDNEKSKQVKIDSVSVSDAEQTEQTPQPDNATPDTESETDKLNAQIAELTDKFLRLAAELENTRRRATLDIESAARNRAMSVAYKFFPVMEALHGAL